MLLLVQVLLSCEPPVGLSAAPGDPCTRHEPPPPSASLYHLDVDLETSDGGPMCLARWRDHPVVISMFYGSCRAACPLIIQKIESVLARLPAKARDQTRVMLVSFDPDRDDPAALRELAAAHGIDAPHWTLARAPTGQVRELAAVLGIRYRRQANEEFDHNVVLTVIDGEGVPVARVDGFGAPDDALVEALTAGWVAVPASR
jgi:protein SCO1/2